MDAITQTNALRVVAFEVGGQACALRMTAVKEILHQPLLHVPPASPEFLSGFLDLAGQPVPVVSLARLLWLEPQPETLYDPLIVLHATPIVALLVDRITDIFEAGEVASLDERDSVNGSIQGMIQVGERVLHLLDEERILLEEERRAIDALESAVTRRLRRVREGTA